MVRRFAPVRIVSQSVISAVAITPEDRATARGELVGVLENTFANITFDKE